MNRDLARRRPQGATIKGRVLVATVVLFAHIFPISLSLSARQDQQGIPSQLSGKQGEVLLVRIPVQASPLRVEGKFLNRLVPFFPGGNNHYAGLVGIEMQAPPGAQDLVVEAHYPDRTKRVTMTVRVLKENYPVQRLKLPDQMVDLDQKTLVRVRAESKEIQQVFRGVASERFWSGKFIEPIQGRVSGRFGSQRIINGQPRSPHSGEDIAAPEGTPVEAMNNGVVRLTMDHFFTGKGVIIDHGLGLFSMYFHLSAVQVEPKERVKKGQVIGKVGATGRATGPHLHWGVRLNGSRVDPYSLKNISVDEVSPRTN